MSTATLSPDRDHARPASGEPRHPLAGTGRLLRLALRRDRIILPIWVVSLVGVAAATVRSVEHLYGSDQALAGYAVTWASSAVALAFNGPAAGPDLGAVMVAESYTLLAILVPLLAVFTVVRHSRQNEETGRAELIGSSIVGRYALLTSALIVASATVVTVAVAVSAVFLAAGRTLVGSMYVGAATAGMGLSFAAVAAVAAQLMQTARAANGVSTAVLAAAFVLRAVGDATGSTGADALTISSGWPSWLSPLGWASQVLPFTEDNGWPLVLTAAFVAACVLLAVVFNGHRDAGSGMIQQRRGPATASWSLRSGLGLAWRLHRGGLAGWLVASVTIGATFGSLTNEVESLARDNPATREIIAAWGGSAQLTDAWLAVMTSFLALAAAGYGVQATLRMRAEEAAGRLEPVLAAAVGRYRWAAGHLTWVAVGAAGVLLIGAAAAGLIHGLTVDDLGQLPRLVGAASVHLPAISVVVGLVVLAVAALPRGAVAIGWSILVGCLLIMQVGELLELPQAVLDVSPFTHTPAVPAVPVRATPLLVMCGLAAAFLVAGMATLRRRDASVG